jgi:hypothetical protein
MSFSEANAELTDVLKRASEALRVGVDNPDMVEDEVLREVLATAVRVYAAKAETGMRHPFPPDVRGLTITETMVTVTDMLHALDVQLFELSMWQAMSGNCIAPHQRIDSTESWPANEPLSAGKP